jgi:hypothetical protein
LALAFAGAAGAVPVDFTNQTNRDVLVESESTSCPTGVQCSAPGVFASDPGASFTFLPDTDSNGRNAQIVFDDPANLGNATLIIDQPDWETGVIAAQGISENPQDPGVVPGSVTSYRILFDSAGNVTGGGWSATLIAPVILVPLALQAQFTPGADGWYWFTIVGSLISISCANSNTPDATQCAANTRAPVPYNPATGTFTGHFGVSNGFIPPAFAPADFRLSEVPEAGSLALLGAMIAGFAAYRRRTA